jgi:hypothetical protein
MQGRPPFGSGLGNRGGVSMLDLHGGYSVQTGHILGNQVCTLAGVQSEMHAKTSDWSWHE